jgi:hypothetical protein
MIVSEDTAGTGPVCSEYSYHGGHWSLRIFVERHLQSRLAGLFSKLAPGPKSSNG